MSSTQDPFYIVKDEIQDSIDSLQGSFHELERVPVGSGEQSRLTKELLSNCESIERQLLETLLCNVLNQVEFEKQRKWTTTARIQVGNIKKAVTVNGSSSNFGGMRQELMRMPKSHQQQDKDRTRTGSYASVDNDDFISLEPVTQMLLIR
uniref:Syntaxin 6/10/61 N-terminal domain-containing protein n=1 Tax=Lactuca sativa TaxID=4236 RepID=A0A9R1VRJ7_LACSA|nr:hypothetical protein LSAT_V11C400208790 [Lactuca sativa]